MYTTIHGVCICMLLSTLTRFKHCGKLIYTHITQQQQREEVEMKNFSTSKSISQKFLHLHERKKKQLEEELFSHRQSHNNMKRRDFLVYKNTKTREMRWGWWCGCCEDNLPLFFMFLLALMSSWKFWRI